MSQLTDHQVLFLLRLHAKYWRGGRWRLTGLGEEDLEELRTIMAEQRARMEHRN